MRRPDFNGHHRAGGFDPGTWFPLITSLGFAVPFSSWLFSSAQPAGFSKYSNADEGRRRLDDIDGVLLFTDQMYKVTIWYAGHYAGVAEILKSSGSLVQFIVIIDIGLGQDL